MNRAVFLAQEGIETTRTIRDISWSGHIAPLTTGQAYYITPSNYWGIVAPNPGLIDGIFTRTVVFDSVYRRDSDKDIVDASSPDPKTIDPGTKKVTVSVSWGTQGRKRTATTYITDLLQN